MLNIITSLSSSILGLLAQGVSDTEVLPAPTLITKAETMLISKPPLFLIENRRRAIFQIAKS